MEVKTFKIRLYYCDDNEERVYIDELSDRTGLSDLRCEYNWLEVCPEFQYYLGKDNNRENWYKLHHGYNDNDIDMEVTYDKNTGFVNCTLVASDSFSKLITVYDNDSKCLITRPLFDWIKKDINGGLSDGIGENEIGYFETVFGGLKYDVWLGDIITDEDLNEYGYFKIDKSVNIIDNPEIIESYYMPAYKEKYMALKYEYMGYFDENQRITPENKENARKCNNEIIKLTKQNEAYMVEHLNQ